MSQPRIGAVIRAVGVSLLATALCVGQLGTATADDLPAPIPVERPSFEEMLAAFDGGALTGRWFVEVDGNPPSRRRDPTPTRTTAWATAHTWPASSAPTARSPASHPR